MTSRTSILLASCTLLAAGPALAGQDSQAAPQPPPAAASGAPTSAAGAATEDDEGTIIVTGQKPRGSVVGDIPPENVLTSRDIRATGATSIAELLDSIAAQTGSARGRTSGPPILLLNGLRISGFRELRDLPPEAIERLEILPEEVALKYGYSADQKVVNIVLRRRFDSTGTEVGGTLATGGGYAAGKADGTRLIIADGRRTSLNLHLEGNNPLYESERNILLDPASTAADARAYRTLVGAQQSARITGTLNRTLGHDIGGTITAELGRIHSRSRFGIDPFNAANPLTRNSTSDSAGLGVVLNAQRGKWRLSSTANADITSTRTDSDRSLLLAPSDDYSRSNSRSLSTDAAATGPLLALPAGDATATFKLGLTRLDLDSRARRVGVNSQANLGRTIGNGSVSLDLPLTRGPSAIGRLTGNLNAGVSQLSDFGTLTSLGGGLNWSPKGNINLIGSATREEGAPTLSQLGDPLVSTVNVPFFDAVRGESVSVTTVTGGNAALAADRRTVWKLGGNWQPSEKLDLRLRADFVHQSIDRPQIGFPAVTPALEAAFPGRFLRDGSGQLVQVDLRPVNADSSRRDTLRWGFDFTKPLKSHPPTREQINALRARLGQPALTGSPGGAASSGGARFDGPRGGGGGRGGGRFGGRTGGRVTLSVTHTMTLTDELVIAPGIAKLDYLRGEALSSTGGRSRHQVEVETGYYNNGVGARVEANWRSATRVNGGLTGQDLRFSDYATIDLRLFANLGERLSLVSKSPFFLGSSLRFEVKNLFDSRPQVRGGSGAIPFAYQPDRLEPIGRTVGISFRKLFLPTRQFRFGGGGGGPAGGGGPPRN